jgi:hypothetical protein
VKGAEELDGYFKTRESNLKANLTTYDTMWSLFIPGEKVYAKPFLNSPQVFVVDIPPYWLERRSPPPKLHVDCWCYDWNGKEMVKVYYSIEIERFRGTKSINELACYPLKYYQDENSAIKNEGELIRSLVNRGKTYDKIVRGPKGAKQMYAYNGDALADQRHIIRQNKNEQVRTSINVPML